MSLININMLKAIFALALSFLVALATSLMAGPPSKEDLKKIQEAAYQHDAQAEFELGCLLSSGEYLPKNLSEAFNLFLKSAAQGLSKAQYKVGMAYFNGKGVSKDQREGLAWVYIAMMDGVPSSVCNSMELSMGSQATKEAKQRSKELIETLPKGPIAFKGEKLALGPQAAEMSSKKCVGIMGCHKAI